MRWYQAAVASLPWIRAKQVVLGTRLPGRTTMGHDHPDSAGRLIRAVLEGEFGTAIRRPPFTARTRADLGRLPK